MELKSVMELPVLQTATISSAGKDPETNNYIVDCLLDLYGGHFGDIPEEDVMRNNAELAEGEGRIVAHYPQKYQLNGDIFVIAEFSEESPGLDGNHVMVMYADEY